MFVHKNIIIIIIVVITIRGDGFRRPRYDDASFFVGKKDRCVIIFVCQHELPCLHDAAAVYTKTVLIVFFFTVLLRLIVLVCIFFFFNSLTFFLFFFKLVLIINCVLRFRSIRLMRSVVLFFLCFSSV